MYGRKRSTLLEALLLVLSVLYRLGSGFRQMLYRYRILKSLSLPCKVISVGNITLGGTGKTPMVIAVARILSAKRRHPVVVSRGYGRPDESKTLVVSDGQSVLVDAHTGGDEPVLIGSKLSGVPVIVGSRRFAAATYAIERFKPDAVILDDGFQHAKLKRDVDVVLIDAADPFGNEKLFPAGILREPVASLRRAQAVIITRANESPALELLKKRIRSFTQARIFTSVIRPIDVINDLTGEVKPLSILRGQKVLAMSGIARPTSFAALLTSLGAAVAGEYIFPDHHVYRKTDLDLIFQRAAKDRVSMIITTEKDAVRLRDLRPAGVLSLRIEPEINEGLEWEMFLLNCL